MSHPIFSIIIPTYQRADIISEALESVRLEQERTDFLIEVIVVDDHSHDDTKSLIEQWCKAHQITWLNYICLPKRSGVCAARNAGIDRAKGRLLAFLDSDDQLLPEALRHIKQTFDAQPSMDIYHGALKLKSEGEAVLAPTSKRECLLDFTAYTSLKGRGEYLQVCRHALLKNPSMRFSEKVNGFESMLWLKCLLNGSKLWIDPCQVRLYDDLRSDRLSHPSNLAKDANRLAVGFVRFFKEFGPHIEHSHADYWASLLLRVVLYNKVAQRWTYDLKQELRPDLQKAPMQIKLLANLPDVFFLWVYPSLNRFRGISFFKKLN